MTMSKLFRTSAFLPTYLCEYLPIPVVPKVKMIDKVVGPDVEIF
jgi:hypothetical protein